MNLLGLFSKPLKPVSELPIAGSEPERSILKNKNVETHLERGEAIKKNVPLVQNLNNNLPNTSFNEISQKSNKYKKKFKRKAKKNYKKYKRYLVTDTNENLDKCIKSWLSFKKNETKNNHEGESNISSSYHPSISNNITITTANYTAENNSNPACSTFLKKTKHNETNGDNTTNQNSSLSNHYSSDLVIEIKNHESAINESEKNNISCFKAPITTSDNNLNSSTNKVIGQYTKNNINQAPYRQANATKTIINNITNNDTFSDDGTVEKFFNESINKPGENDASIGNYGKCSNIFGNNNNNNNNIKSNNNPQVNSNHPNSNNYDRGLVSYENDVFSPIEDEKCGGSGGVKVGEWSRLCDNKRNNCKNTTQNRRNNSNNNKRHQKNNKNIKALNKKNNNTRNNNNTNNNIIRQKLNLIRFANESMQESTEVTKDTTNTHRKYLKPIKKNRFDNNNTNKIENNNNNKNQNININNNNTQKRVNSQPTVQKHHSTPPQGYIDALVTATEDVQADDVAKKQTETKNRKKRKRKKNTAYMDKKKQRSQRQEVVPKRVSCKFYVNGCCNKGDACPFSHDVAQEKKAQVCKFYVMHKCTKDSCLYYHHDWPCKFFHTKGMCYNKDICKFSHLPLNDITQQLLKKILEEDSKLPKTPEASNFHLSTTPLINHPISATILTPSFLPVWNPQPLYVNPHIQFKLIPFGLEKSVQDESVQSNGGVVLSNVKNNDKSLLVGITDKDEGAYQNMTNSHDELDNDDFINEVSEKLLRNTDPRLNRSSYVRNVPLKSSTTIIPLVSSTTSFDTSFDLTTAMDTFCSENADPFKLYHL